MVSTVSCIGSSYIPGVIDTHCHLTFPEFAGRLDEVMAEAAALGVTGAITIATATEDSEAALRVAESHPAVWCTAGVHPLYSDRGPHDWKRIRRVIEHPRCVGFGELGLDNHHGRPPRDVQDLVLADELAFIESCLADGIDKPVVIHCRKAVEDLLPVLRSTKVRPERFVFHCFTETPEHARMVLDFGAFISFTGVVTYKNAREVVESAALVPADRILVETDAPYLSPEPLRGRRPCMPGYARLTAEALAKLRGVGFAEFHAQIDANTRAFFGIEPPAPAPGVLTAVVS
jgi:TatD DNase family protein